MSKRRQNALDLDTKLRMLQELDRGGVSKTSIAEQYGIPKSTLSTILKSREKIYNAFATGSVVHKAKRMRNATYKEVEDKLIQWIDQMRSVDIFVSGVMIQEKARDLATNLGFTNFKCSNGWLDHFKARFRISTRAPCCVDKPKEDDDVIVNQWLDKFLTVLKEYRAEDVFSLEETDVFCDALQVREQNLVGGCLNGGSENEWQTSTFVLCCNSNGSEKLKPLGRTSCSNPGDPERLSADYSHTFHKENNFVTEAGSMHNWLLEFNSRMAAQSRNVLVVLDSAAACDVENWELPNIQLYFLPPHSRGRLQPLHQGVTSLLKSRFCDKFVQDVAQNDEKSGQIMTQSVAQRAMELAWDSIPPDYIRYCFQETWVNHDGLICVETILQELPEEHPGGLKFRHPKGKKLEKFPKTEGNDSPARGTTFETNGDCYGSDQKDWKKSDVGVTQVEPPSQDQIFSALDTLRTFAGTSDVTAEFLGCLDLITHECVDHHLRMKNDENAIR